MIQKTEFITQTSTKWAPKWSAWDNFSGLDLIDCKSSSCLYFSGLGLGQAVHVGNIQILIRKPGETVR